MVAKKPRAAAATAADPVNTAIKKLQQIQDELQKVTKEEDEEILEIEQNYMEKRKPVYKRRHKIISEIPEFWLSIFLTHPKLQNLLTEEDQKIFVYLDSINVEDFADPRTGCCITFKFKANPFLKNKELIKTIKLSDEGSSKSIGTNIHWKAGKRPIGRAVKKGSKRPLPSYSFFTWFDSTDEVKRDLVTEIIRGEIWLDPIDHVSYPDDEDDYEDDDDDDDDDDYDEDDDICKDPRSPSLKLLICMKP